MAIPTDHTNFNAVSVFIEAIYSNLFSHPADFAGWFAYWHGQISSGAVSLGAAIYDIANGASGNDQTVLGLKIAAAQCFTTETFSTNLGTSMPLTQDFLTHAHNSVVNVVAPATLQASQVDTGHYGQNTNPGPPPSTVEVVGQAHDTSQHVLAHG